MGELPELGKESKETPAIYKQKAQPEIKEDFQEINPVNRVAPRPSAGYTINKYSNYLADMKEVYFLLKEVKSVLQEENKDKVQLFCAKVNLLNLYTDALKEKYNDRPEHHYESYKQLITLNTYLTEVADYKVATDKLRETQRGTLKDKIEDEKFLRQKVEKALEPINIVIEIIEDAN